VLPIKQWLFWRLLKINKGKAQLKFNHTKRDFLAFKNKIKLPL
jgi:hypothetical protein